MTNLMELVRELKSLNARKKAGELLEPTEEMRRKELKVFLRSTLDSPAAGSSLEDSAIQEAPTRRPDPLPPQADQPASHVTRSAPRPVSTPPIAPVDELMDEMPSPLAAPAPVRQPFVPRKDIYAIANASAYIDEAMSSEAVARVDPFANRKAHASSAEVADAEARAEAAFRANKKRQRAKNADEAVQQLQEAEGGYTPPDDDFVNEQYYGSFQQEGFVVVSAAEAGDLKPIDPRDVEISKLDVAGGPTASATNAAVPVGLAFLDDFPALYARRVLAAPDDELVIDSDDPNMLIPGKRKVTVHLLNGEKKQGAIRALRRGELGFKLEPMGNGQIEDLSIAQVKAVFIHMQANAVPRDAVGRTLTATFRDGRAVQGVSDDYQPGAPMFTLVPPAGRGQFERILVNGAAVQSVL